MNNSFFRHSEGEARRISRCNARFFPFASLKGQNDYYSINSFIIFKYSDGRTEVFYLLSEVTGGGSGRELQATIVGWGRKVRWSRVVANSSNYEYHWQLGQLRFPLIRVFRATSSWFRLSAPWQTRTLPSPPPLFLRKVRQEEQALSTEQKFLRTSIPPFIVAT